MQSIFPPLRERKDDIEPLVTNCIRRFNTRYRTKFAVSVSPTVLAELQNHTWPGNIRELFNVVERAIVNREAKGQLELKDITIEPTTFTKTAARVICGAKTGLRIGGRHTLQVVEKAHMEGVLESVGFNKNQAADILGISRNTIYRKVANGEIIVPLPEGFSPQEKAEVEETLVECEYVLPRAAETLGISEDDLKSKIENLGILMPGEPGFGREDEEGGTLANVAKAAAEEAERELIFQALEKTHWNRRNAAPILGVSYKTLLNKIKQLNITPDSNS